MKTLNLSSNEVDSCMRKMVRQMNVDHWQPDIVVALARGGLAAGVGFSHYYDVPLVTIPLSKRDNLVSGNTADALATLAQGAGLHDRILVVDDINDSGETLASLVRLWDIVVLPKKPDLSIKYATIVNNGASTFKDINYAGLSINKHDDPVWVVFPWENWYE